MDVEIVVSKRAQLLSVLYDLYHVPSLMENDHLYVFNLGEVSRYFYVGMMLDRYNLWDKAFDNILNIKMHYEAEKYMEILDSIDIFRWELIESELRDKGLKISRDTYPKIKGKLERTLKEILELNRLFPKFYIILGLNPFKGTLGSLPVYREGYAVSTIMSSPTASPEEILDLAIHELLHGLIRLNNLPIPEEAEEDFIDTLCPDGHLSKYLGLSDKLRIGEGAIQSMISAYFNERLYEKGISLVEYLKMRMMQPYHL